MNDIGLLLADKNDYIVPNFGLVPPITVSDFIHMGSDYEKFYEDIILPWRIGWRSYYTETDYNKIILEYNDIHDFDIFFLRFYNGEMLTIDTHGKKENIVNLLKKSIDFIFKDECKINYVKNMFELSDGRVISRENYNEICDIILKTNSCEKSEMDEPPKFENERQMDIYYKLEEGRKRRANNNSIKIKQLLNIVMVYTKYQINDVIKNMTLYQLLNTYSSFIAEDSYKTNQSYIPVVADFSKLDLEHWSTKLK